MTPLLKSRQPVRLTPIEIRHKYPTAPAYAVTLHTLEIIKDLDKYFVGSIVFCKVRGNYYIHLVKAYNPNRGFLIGNNHGHNNGWTWSIFGKVVEILPMDYKE